MHVTEHRLPAGDGWSLSVLDVGPHPALGDRREVVHLGHDGPGHMGMVTATGSEPVWESIAAWIARRCQPV